MDDNQLPKQANSMKDKVLILQARDKYVKSQRIKQTDINKAQVVSGNCRDMCPESERYRRLEHDLVSIFEKNNDETDEHKLVKEYVRSSADQDEPLPYELRPADVLERTMLYLARNIIDLIDEDEDIDIEQWYDFLWNRTRAIRKEIVQQDLNCLTSVLLMERCARFHIYSAHRFVEADLNVFPKINEENLTKSIQSLKDFYYDLSLKNVQCPNEAEFRGYDILLNLLNGDILREISILRPAIRNSEPVKFAAKVLTAFNNKNFVKFFDLMREATFLNGCIMHRYFGIMRIQAFRLLRKAFTIFSVNQQEYFSKDYLFDQLCFEEDSEFDDFCDKINVEVDKEEAIIILEKHSLQEFKSEDSLPQPFEFVNKRSIEYIDAKKGNKMLSELIFKEEMAENPYKKYPLQNSFDENGQLKSTELELDNKKIKIDQATVYSFANSNKKENKSDQQQKNVAFNFGTSSKGLFSQPNIFKNVQQSNSELGMNLFGKRSTTTFPSSANTALQQSNIFSLPNTTVQPSSGLFSSATQNLFGKNTESQVNKNLFGLSKESPSSTNLFGQESQPPPSTASLFGTTQNLFSNTNLFANSTTNKPFSFKLPSDSSTVKVDQSEPSVDKPKESKLDEEELSCLTEKLFQDILDQVLHDLIEKSILNVFINDQSIEMTNLIMTEVVVQSINDLCKSVFDYEIKKQEKLKHLINQTSSYLCNHLIKEQLDELVSSIAKNIYVKELNSFIHIKSQLISNSYFEETFEQLIFDICNCILQTELEERQRIVNYIEEKRGWRLARNYFKHWKKRCDHLRRYRFLRDNFPASRFEYSLPTLKRALSVPELVQDEPTSKRQLVERIDRPELYQNTFSIRSSLLNLDLTKESNIAEELRTIQEQLKKREKHDELSTKSKLEYAKKALDSLKKVSKTFNNSLTFVRPFLNKNN